MANAVIMKVKLVGEPELADKMLNEIVIPNARAMKGFKAGTWLHDGAGNGMSVIIFATEEDAIAAKDALKPPPGGPELVSSELWTAAATA